MAYRYERNTMTVTIDLPELIGARIQDTPEGMARARRVLAREFAGIDLEAVEAILESFTEEGEDMDVDDAFDTLEAKIRSRSAAGTSKAQGQ